MVEREILSTFGCPFPSKRSFEKSKNTKVCLNLTLNGGAEMLFCEKINLVQCIPCGQYILADRFFKKQRLPG